MSNGSSDKCLPITISDITLILHCGQLILNWLILKLIENNEQTQFYQNIVFQLNYMFQKHLVLKIDIQNTDQSSLERSEA